MGSWSAPPSRCLASARAPHGPQTRGMHAPCVHEPRPSVRGRSWRGETRVLEETMGLATTHASHQPQAELATELPRCTVAGPPVGPGTQHQGLGLVLVPW